MGKWKGVITMKARVKETIKKQKEMKELKHYFIIYQ